MNEDGPEGASPPNRKKAFRLARWHGFVFAGVNAVLILIDLLTGPPMWSIWPLLGWGVVFAFHYFYVRSVYVNEDWADQRTQDLRLKSYDLSHIDWIQSRHGKKRSRRSPDTSDTSNNRP